MDFETETIDKLFLELSQFTSAKTRKELAYTFTLRKIADGTYGGAVAIDHAQRVLDAYDNEENSGENNQ